MIVEIHSECFETNIRTTMDSYGTTARIITILNHVAALRNFIDPRKNQLKFVCCWTWNIFLILMVAVVQFRVELYVLQRMPLNIEHFAYIFQYVTHAFGYTSTVIIGLYQSKNALRLMEQIDRVDENLKNLGIEIDYRRLSRHVKIVGSFWLLNAIIILGIFIAWVVRTIIPLSCSSTFTYIYITNAQSIVLYDYNTAIFWLGSRFKVINQLLKTLLPEDDERNTMESNEKFIFKPSSNFRNRLEIDCSVSARSSEVSQTSSMNDTSNFKKGSPTDGKLYLLQQIRSLHLQVCSVSKLVNQMFNVQILIYTFTTLVYISISTYWIYMEIQRKTDVVEKLDLVLIFLLDGVVGSLKIAVMSYDCEYTMGQASKMIDLIHSCTLYQESAELKDETLQFLWQISYTQLEDTNSVRYILNYGFVRDCLYFVLTYLVIMIQLSQNLTKNDQINITNGTIF
ncbi:uncharacterized protein LOC122527243 isoform X2 [Frieseomelitta varia]|uniref:uncharacterized protein LOC122527243 isoform X2 n=1 Tax=Frieseomelitta varia TaxID=561572 RepID=UPI001CB6A7F3|nr:uncharacterized protein LOC122527243 isoform X2 [Frieseomelitta varia]